MKRNVKFLLLASLMGAVPAVLAGWGVSALTWERVNAPFTWAGGALRTLSLSSMAGNMAAWAVTLLICALPLLLLWKRKTRGWEDVLPVAAVPVLFMGVFFLVNPSWLDTPLRELYPIMALQTALSLIAAWLVLKLLRGMEDASAGKLAGMFRWLFQVCAVLVTAGAVFRQISGLLTRWNNVVEGNTAVPDSIGLTLGVLAGLTVLRLIPDLLAGLTLLWGGELAESLGAGSFDETGVALSQKTADSCRRAAQAAVAAAMAANVLQLLLIEQLHDASFTLEIPLLSLALSAGLFLLCRLLQRARELQEDSDSII